MTQWVTCLKWKCCAKPGKLILVTFHQAETLEIIHGWCCSAVFLCSLILGSVVVLLERTEGMMDCD